MCIYIYIHIHIHINIFMRERERKRERGERDNCFLCRSLQFGTAPPCCVTWKTLFVVDGYNFCSVSIKCCSVSMKYCSVSTSSVTRKTLFVVDECVFSCYRMCPLVMECVLLLYYRMCSLAIL